MGLLRIFGGEDSTSISPCTELGAKAGDAQTYEDSPNLDHSEHASGDSEFEASCGAWEVLSAPEAVEEFHWVPDVGKGENTEHPDNTDMIITGSIVLEDKPDSLPDVSDVESSLLQVADGVPSSKDEVQDDEVNRLRQALLDAEAQVEMLRAHQERQSKEIRAKDAEIASLLQQRLIEQHSDDLPKLGSRTQESEVTFCMEGPLGLEFEKTTPPYVIESVVPGSQADGHVAPGDHLVEVDGQRTEVLQWSDLRSALGVRPVTVCLARVTQQSNFRHQGASEEATWNGVGAALRCIAGNGITKAIAAVLLPFDSNDGATSQPEVEGPAPETLSSEIRNQPFIELVRSSMRIALASVGPGEETFEAWLREFHDERDDRWYVENYSRIERAFRPHWDEVRSDVGLHKRTTNGNASAHDADG